MLPDLRGDYHGKDSTDRKNARAHSAKTRGLALYFRLAFILSKQRAVMVNALHRMPMNPALSEYPLQTPQIQLGALMPKQRKVFRVEEMSHGEMPIEFPESNSENASRHAELMAELRTLRAMLMSA